MGGGSKNENSSSLDQLNQILYIEYILWAPRRQYTQKLTTQNRGSQKMKIQRPLASS